MGFYVTFAWIMSMSYMQLSGNVMTDSGILGHWFLNGSDPDLSFHGPPISFTEGRCPGSKAANLSQIGQYATTTKKRIHDESFTIACWINVPTDKQNQRIFAVLSPPFGFSFSVFDQYIYFGYSNAEAGTMLLAVRNITFPFNTWTHVAVTLRQKTRSIRLYVNGEEVERSSYSSYWNSGAIGKTYTITIGQIFGSIMDLYVFRRALSMEELNKLRGFAMVVNKTNEVEGDTVEVTWEPPFEGSCNVFMYTVYYREVMSLSETSNWSTINVTKHITHVTLQLYCFKKYEISVTTWCGTCGETPLDLSNLWNVTTGTETLTPPVINGADVSWCDVNLKWASHGDKCPPTMYTIYYKEIQSGIKDQIGWVHINVTQVKKTTYLLTLTCDTLYEFAVSTWHDKKHSGQSRVWQRERLRVLFLLHKLLV